MNKKKCLHKWIPIAIDLEEGYIIYQCIECEEVLWDYLYQIENKNFNNSN